MNSTWRDHAAIAMKWLVRLEQIIAIGLLVVILATMGIQVVARYIFQSPLSWSEEIARLGMIWLTFVASGFVAAHHQHIAVDLFAQDVDAVGKTEDEGDAPLCDTVAETGSHRSWQNTSLALLYSTRLPHGVVLISTLLLLIGGLRFVWRVYPVGSPGVGISMTYWYGAASIGLALIAVHAAADLLGVPQPRSDSQETAFTKDAK